MKLLFILLLGLGFTQTEITTKKFNIPYSELDSDGGGIDIDEYFGFEGMAIVSIRWNIEDCNDIALFQCESQENPVQLNRYGMRDNHVSLYCNENYGYYGDGIRFTLNNVWALENSNCSLPNEVTLFITAEFPEEDTGYIEDGFEFCLTPGANLLSFPCDSPINVGESLPQGVENFITEIVGQGVAASYNPALGWIGNLAEFTPGSGYWFKSNESLCFEYDCVED